MKYRKFKSGFTLIELMVFFVFLTILLAASTPLVTKRVKMPTKVYHGKYICYGDENGLHQVKYNSTKIVSNTSVTSCSFDPPQNVAMYKIQLIGAGAGGIDYTNVGNSEDTRNSEFYFNGSQYTYSGERYANLSDAQIKTAIDGAFFRLTRATAVGGEGETLKFEYLPGTPSGIRYRYMSSATEPCLNDDGSICSSVQAKVSLIIEDLYKRGDLNGNYIRLGDCTGMPDEKCTQFINLDPVLKAELDERLKSELQIEIVDTPAQDDSLGIAGNGGAWCNESNRYIYIEGNLDLSYSLRQVGYNLVSQVLPTEGISDYLTGLFTNTIIKGSMSKNAYESGGYGAYDFCEGWSTSAPSNGVNREIRNIDISKEFGTIEGEPGGDVERYAAIKYWTKCVTNEVVSKGSPGGWVHYDYGSGFVSRSSSEVVPPSGKYRPNAEPAKGLSFRSSVPVGYVRSAGITEDNVNPGDVYPAIRIDSNLKTRLYKVGLDGSPAGEPLTVYVPSLANCQFNVPVGGPPVKYEEISDAYIKQLEQNLDTTLSCNDGNLYLTAEGGHYNLGFFDDIYNPFNDIVSNPDGSLNLDRIPDAYTSPDDAEEYTNQTTPPSLDSSSVFTSSVVGEYGTGGRGSIIVDRCTMPRGKYDLYRNNSTGGYDHRFSQYLDDVECTEAMVERKQAEPGKGGAIIISW